jgi:hypothetical protein
MNLFDISSYLHLGIAHLLCFFIPTHQHAAASSLSKDKYYGTQATFNVWQPTLETTDDFSLAQLWIISESDNGLNTIEVGWEVRHKWDILCASYVYKLY